jgi:DNA ligase (NAD+)
MTLLELQQKIDKATYAYYNIGSPIVDDVIFDSWIDELKTLNPNDLRLKRVGCDVRDSMLEKVKLTIEMGSQDKVNSRVEYDQWLRNNIYKHGIPQDEKFVVSHKMDGLSLECTFKHNELVLAATRGSGEIGENITANARLFKGIPKKLNFNGYVRGEVVLNIDDWEKIDIDKSSNPRNKASLARRKNGLESENLTFYAFKIYDTDGNPIGNTEEESLKKLKELGFNTVEYFLGDSDEVWEWYNKVSTNRKNLNFWVDGVVISLNSIEYQQQLGSSNNRPKSSIAAKFISETATSTLLGIKVQVGSQGQIAPVAIITPCQIGGATIESPTLHNYDIIENLGLCIGDEVEVCKMNDIIPNIIRVITPGKNRIPIVQPTNCPCCGGKLDKKTNIGGDDSIHIFCINEDCPAQVSGKISKYVKSLDIQGLGDSIIDDLIKNKLINTAADLYLLKNHKEELADLMLSGKTRLGEKRANKILDNIENKRKLPLNEFLGSLGISSLGKRRVALVIENLSEMNNLDNWFTSTLTEKASQSTLPNAAIEINKEIIKKKDYIMSYIKNGVEIEEAKKSTVKDGALLFCLTGSPMLTPDGEKVTKEWYHNLIEQSGNQWTPSYNKSVNYLVTADPTNLTSKLEKAKKNGTLIINHEALLKLIGQ